MRRLILILAVWLGSIFGASSADATIIYSFSNVKMVDSYTPTTGPYVFASGSFEIESARNAPLQTKTVDLLVPLAVDFSITNNSGFTYNFTDPSIFLYAD